MTYDLDIISRHTWQKENPEKHTLIETAISNGFYIFKGDLRPNLNHKSATKFEHIIGTNDNAPYTFIPLVEYTQCAQGVWEGIRWTTDKTVPQPTKPLKDDKNLPDNVYVVCGEPKGTMPNIAYAVRLHGKNLNHVEMMLDSFFRAHVRPYEIRLKVSLSDIAVIFSHVWYQLFTYYGDYYGGGSTQRISEQVRMNHSPDINYFISGWDNGGGLPKELCEELNRIAGTELWKTENAIYGKVITSEHFTHVELPTMPYGYNYEGFYNPDAPVYELKNDCIPLDVDPSHFREIAGDYYHEKEHVTPDCLKEFKDYLTDYYENDDFYFDSIEFLTGGYYDNLFFKQNYGQEYKFPYKEPYYGYGLSLADDSVKAIENVTIEDLAEWLDKPVHI